jgi:hypothetical protein
VVVLTVVAFAFAGSAGAVKVPGTWFFLVEVPASPFTGGQDVVLPEFGTFGKGGGVVVSSAMTAFLFPRGGDMDRLKPVLMGTGHANWKKLGSGFRTTNLRCLNDPKTGELVGFLKIYVESESCTSAGCVGTWYGELLTPDLELVEMPEDIVVAGEWQASRVAVESMPEF